MNFTPQETHNMLVKSLSGAVLFNFLTGTPLIGGFILSGINDVVVTSLLKNTDGKCPYLEYKKNNATFNNSTTYSEFDREIGGYIY